MKVYARCGHTGILNYLGELTINDYLGYTYRLAFNGMTVVGRVENLETSNAGKWGGNPKLATVTQERVLVFDAQYTKFVTEYIYSFNQGEHL